MDRGRDIAVEIPSVAGQEHFNPFRRHGLPRIITAKAIIMYLGTAHTRPENR